MYKIRCVWGGGRGGERCLKFWKNGKILDLGVIKN